MRQRKPLMTFLVMIALAATAITATAFPPPGPPEEGDPAHGSITAHSLTYANSTLSASATYNAIVPEADTQGSWFHSWFYATGGSHMTATGADEYLAPNQSATWTLQTSQPNPPSGHHIRFVTLSE